MDGHTPVNGRFIFTYYVGGAVGGSGSSTAPTTVGSYTVLADFISYDANYTNACSPSVTFTISPAPTTLSAPTPIAPLGAVAASTGYDTPTFSWSSVSGANHYYLYVLDATNGQPVINNGNVSGTSFTANTALAAGHSFVWYIGATTLAGGIFWTGPESFTLASLAVPAQTGPSGTIPAGISFDTPTLSWSSVPGASFYYLYVLDTSTNQPAVNSSNVSSASFTASAGLTPGHSFAWYVGAEGALGAAGSISWSGPQSFALAALAVPTLLRPAETSRRAAATTRRR